MKVLFVASSGAPNGLYGGSVALLNLIKNLYQKIEIAVLFPDKGLLCDELEKIGVKCFYSHEYNFATFPPLDSFRDFILFPLKLIHRIERKWRGQYCLANTIKKFRPDIIHTNVGPVDIAHQVAKKMGIPHVWHLREYQDLDFGMKPFPSMKSFKRKVHNPNTHAIAITKDVFKHFQLDTAKDIVVYDGVFATKDKLIQNSKRDGFLFVGSIKEAKGVKHLLEAYAMYRCNGGRQSLMIAGDGGPQDYKEECLSLVKANQIEEHVQFLGFCNNVYELMQNARALVVPSRFEGFGFITAEAMYNGCLVIGRNTAGTKEQMDNGLSLTGAEIALRFETTDELAKALINVDRLDANEYEKITSKAFCVVNQLYSNEICSAQIHNFYYKVLKRI